MDTALKPIKQKRSIIHAHLDAGCVSESNFKNVFYTIIGKFSPSKSTHSPLVLKASWINTRLGPMIAISDDNSLYLLEFSDRRGLEKRIKRLCNRKKAAIIHGYTNPISMIKKELELYFSGKLKLFKTPLHLIGSDFQKKAWNTLLQIPYGQTRSYKNQAEIIGNKQAFRAVANANGANQLAIIIPCHRIINSNGKLGGYGGRKARKEWMLKHEKSYV